MDSLAQSLVWLAWESYPAADSSLAVPPPQTRAQSSLPAPAAGPAVAIAAGALILGGSLGSPAWANNYNQDNYSRGQPIYAYPGEGYALNVRKGAGTNYPIIHCVSHGSPLTASGVESRNGWVELVDGNWVAGNLVRRGELVGPTTPLGRAAPPNCRFDPTTPLDPNLATVKIPQNFALNIRSGPGVNYRIVGQYLNGTQIRLTGRFQVGWAELTNNTWVDSGRLQYSGPRVEIITNPISPLTPPEVIEVQRRLQQLGYLPASFAITGIYDQATQNAVREFQRGNGLPVTGDVDGATRQALFIATIPNNDVRDVQRRLQLVGSLPANFTITGINDQTTQNAVRDFQRVNGLPVTGMVDAATRNKLYQVTASAPIPAPTPTPTPPVTDNRQRRVVTGGEPTSVFNGPDPNSGILRSVPDGAIVTITGRSEGNWSELLEGGWIFTPWLDPM